MVITSGPGAEPYEALMARRRVMYVRIRVGAAPRLSNT